MDVKNVVNSILEGEDILSSVLEGKQVGTLYHFTRAYSLLNILKQNFLKAGYEFGDHYVSFTRDKRFDYTTDYGENFSVRFTVDGDKLSDRYRILPINYWAKIRNGKLDGFSPSIHHTRDYESEERLICFLPKIPDKPDDQMETQDVAPGVKNFLNFVTTITIDKYYARDEILDQVETFLDLLYDILGEDVSLNNDDDLDVDEIIFDKIVYVIKKFYKKEVIIK